MAPIMVGQHCLPLIEVGYATQAYQMGASEVSMARAITLHP